MTRKLSSGPLGGLISCVTWMIISMAVGMGKGAVIIGGLVFLIATWLIGSAISTVIDRRRSGSAAH